MIGANYQTGKGRWSIICASVAATDQLEDLLSATVGDTLRGAPRQVLLYGRRAQISRRLDALYGATWRAAVARGDAFPAAPPT